MFLLSTPQVAQPPRHSRIVPQSFDRSLTLAHISHCALIDLGQLPLPFLHLELLPTPTLMYLEYL
jgi:hypothetical protein